MNRHLPYVKDIGLKDSTIYFSVSHQADSIKVTGQDYKTLSAAYGSDSIEYCMQPDDSYARLTAWFPDGEVIYSNPFARYDASVSESPFNEAPQDVDFLLTILFNLLAAAVSAACAYILYKIIRS